MNDRRIERVSCESIAEALKRSAFWPDGAGFVDLDPSGRAIQEKLSSMPLPSSDDFEARGFDFGAVADAGSAVALIEGLVERGQLVISTFPRFDGPRIAEEAFLRAFSGKAGRTRPLILNFAASLDGLIDSSPSAEWIHLGLQDHCCRRSDVEAADRLRMKSVPLGRIENGGIYEAIEEKTTIAFSRPTWIRFDLDSLAAGQGGGVRSWPTGLRVNDVVPAVQWLIRQTRVAGISVGPTAELAENSLGVRAAAQLLSLAVHAHAGRRLATAMHAVPSAP